jgi:broad specificity phosphatase PhoE
VVLVGHQIVNKVLACTLLSLELDRIWHLQQDTAGISIFQRMDDSWCTLVINDTCHLP